MDKTEKIKEHFEKEAKEFDGIILNLIPYYKQMIEALVLSIPFGKDDKINIIDLGCGTGTITETIKISFPHATVTCLDLAESMLDMAKNKLENFDDLSFIQGDFYNFEFPDKYDVIISSLALHHLVTDEDKKSFYAKIYDSLNINGVFYNADVVLGTNKYIQNMFMDKWKEFMMKNVGKEETENKWIPKYYEEDCPTSLMTHFKLTDEVGFKDFDVIWKYYNFAVFGCYK